MIYVTCEDLCRDIRQNLDKIPRDVCGVIGVPRSGMLPATIIAEYLNVPMYDLHSFNEIGHGGRPLHRTSGRKFLVVDDTCFNGYSTKETKQLLLNRRRDGADFVFLVVYLEGPCFLDGPDVYLRDVREEAKSCPFGWAMYEWNIFAHGALTERTLFDLDGVIFVDPPDERDVEAYEAYIKNPTPLHVPTGKTNICTYRLEKYADITLESLDAVGVEYESLTMAKGRDIPSWRLKANMYANERWVLFVESSEAEARKIQEATGKPVFCVETNELYY